MIKKNDKSTNPITRSLWLFTLLIAGLLLISFVPEIKIGDFKLRRIDILSDLRPDPPKAILIQKDSTTQNLIEDSISKSIHPLINRIEDFSKDKSNLSYFYEALKRSKKKPVRIAFFGDSFIEGDIITAPLRDTLQKIFGGNGVGWVPIASETYGFRKSIKHNYSNWSTFSIISQETTIPIGISGYTYIPENNNEVIYKPGKIPPQPNFKTANIYYQLSGTGVLYYRINGGPELIRVLKSSGLVDRITITQEGMESIQFRVESTDPLYVFGVSFEEQLGIYLDNFSLRRNSGIALAKLSPSLLKKFNEYLDYKLIILQYGLNVASEMDSTNYRWYADKMVTIIKNLKNTFPKTSFLLLSVSDRGTNKDGKIVTMEAITRLRMVQKQIAKRSEIAFWDLFEAMGGENSIASFTEADPPLAAKDYTHLNHLGGVIIGRKLAESLIQEERMYDK